MSNDYCFRRVVQGQLLQCNKRNTATVLRAVIKVLDRPKLFACGYPGRNPKNFSKLTGKNPCWSPFILKLQPGTAYQTKVQSKGHSGSTLSKKRPLHRDF